jgi:hypothetical protein
MKLFDDLLKSLNSKKQTDLILLDFSKAFDKVEKLLFQLHGYGIRGSSLKWIKGFLDDRHQSVVVIGSSSESIPVSSGVPQGLLLGPLLFLVYINDFPQRVKFKVKLFADETAIYLTISSTSQSEILQKDLNTLEHWSHEWDMEFNPSKGQVLYITRAKSPLDTKYYLHNTLLESLSSAKYLGIDISSNLSWDIHIEKIT